MAPDKPPRIHGYFAGGAGVCRAVWLSVWLLLITCAGGHVRAGDEWQHAPEMNAVWSHSAESDPVARFSSWEIAADGGDLQLNSGGSFAGYDNGFLIAGDGTHDAAAANSPFLMRIRCWSQLRQIVFQSDGPNPDRNVFSLERIRLSLGGHVYSPSLEYFLQFDGNSDRSLETVFVDGFCSYDLGHEFYGWERHKLGVRAGKWKMPFSRSREETARRLQFTERSMTNLFFDINRSIGVGLFGQIDTFVAPVIWETAVFNGFRTGVDSTLPDAGLDTNLGWSMRTHTDLFSPFGEDGEPDLSWHPTAALRLGSGLAVTRVDNQGFREFDRQRVVDSGVTLASLLPPDVDAYNVCFLTTDAHWKYRGLSFIAEYHWRYLTEFNGGAVPNLLDHGLVLQTGYFVCPHKLELLLRWTRIVGDSGTLGLEEQSVDEFATGFAWYIKGHNAKFVVDASHVNGVPLNSARLDLLPGDVGWLLRSQFQIGF